MASIDMLLVKVGITKKGITWDVLNKDTGEKLVEARTSAIAAALDHLANTGHSGKPWRIFDTRGMLLMSGAKIKAKKAE